MRNVDIASCAGSSLALEKVRILLVDHHPSTLLAHESVLSELDQNIVTATCGSEALECLLKYEFAVILLDVNMPDVDGFTIAATIRQRPRFPTCTIHQLPIQNTLRHSGTIRAGDADIPRAASLFDLKLMRGYAQRLAPTRNR
jgi:CheY-like chemotaxis protein